MIQTFKPMSPSTTQDVWIVSEMSREKTSSFYYELDQNIMKNMLSRQNSYSTHTSNSPYSAPNKTHTCTIRRGGSPSVARTRAASASPGNL